MSENINAIANLVKTYRYAYNGKNNYREDSLNIVAKIPEIAAAVIKQG